MRLLISLAAVLALSAGVAAAAPARHHRIGAAPAPLAAYEADKHSFARPLEARVTHVAIDLTADFETKRLSGTATLDLARAPGSTAVVLDTRDLDIAKVADTKGHGLKWALGASSSLGRPLSVELPVGVTRIVVTYATRPEASALQWLSPELTAGKTRPYLFSQGESVQTRTWIPTQDSPGIRQSYDAKITARSDLTAVMSAERLTPAGEAAGKGMRRWRFHMAHPIPPYLIAVAIGDLKFRKIGPRTGVWTEPSMLDRTAYEFADMEKMVTVAEQLYGPYRWGRYDILVLPPSFPYGGMENPTLTFATPTVLAGDRSLVSLVAHELAHSWSGNLVTNATWNDIWLNEGVTTYIQGRIVEKLYGRERAAMEDSLAWAELQRLYAGTGRDKVDTRLRLDLGDDPDDTSDIAYEKGATFLRTIEHTVGRARFDTWLKGYFNRHAFQPTTSKAFLSDIRAHLVRGDKALERRLQLDAWVYQAALPSNAWQPSSTAFARVEADARRFLNGAPAASIKTDKWSSQEWQHFLEAVPPTLSRARLDDLDQTFHLSRTGNSEVLFDWLIIAVHNRYDPALPSLEHFLTSQGRMKFVRPLYQALMDQGDWGQPVARRIYATARAGYHPLTAQAVDTVMTPKPAG